MTQPGLGEECDDGNADNEDGCSNTCLEEGCGDGVLQVLLGEECDDGNLDAEDGCSDVCVEEYCGDGIVQAGLGEICDDGNAIDDDGCPNSCVPASLSCTSGGVDLLINSGFEDGVFAPFTSSGAATTVTTDSYDGVWAAITEGNYYVQQYLATPEPVLNLVSASFWTWHEPKDSPLQSIEWGYSDGSTDSTLRFSGDLAGWVQVDLLPEMDPTRDLSYIRVWGYSGGGAYPDITLYDQFEFCAY